MELGTGLITCQRRPDDGRSYEEIYDEAITFSRAAENAGLDSVWVSEHHFSDDGYMPGVMPTLGAIAEATERVEIGTCIALAPFYDPIRIAEDAATLSLLSNGRMTLGLGVGYNEDEFDRFGVPKSERAARIEDVIRVCRGAWSEGPLEYDSEFHAAPPDTVVTPAPTTEPSVLVGAYAQPAVRRAARMGDGWCATSRLSQDDLDARVSDIERVRRDEGIDGDFTNYVLVNGFVADSEDEAWETVRDSFVHIEEQYAEFRTGEPVELGQEEIQSYKDNGIFGTPAQVCERLERYRESLGDDCHVIFRSYHLNIGTDEMVRCLERIGDEVIPAL